jgi:hypothetical protein
VQDNLGFSAQSQVTVTISAPDAALQARVTSPAAFTAQSMDGNTTVTLDGSASTALPGRPIQLWSWEVRADPLQSNPNFLISAFGAKAQVTLPVGVYNVTLHISDGSGLTSAASRSFVIGAGRADGLIAVISQPGPWVAPPPLPPAPSPSPRTKWVPVRLDARGTTPSPGNSMTQYVWAVLRLPDKTPVANASGIAPAGATTVVSLAPGDYQLGLLAIDASGDNAIAKKNFSVAAPVGRNSPPTLPAGLAASGPSGGVAVLPAITDPDLDPVQLSWVLDPGGLGVLGQGTVVSLRGVAPGDYTLSLTASDSRGASSSAMMRLRVLPAGGGAAPGLPLRLPSLTLCVGAAMILDAGATGVPGTDRGRYNYAWALFRKASGIQIDSSDCAVARFNLTSADTYQLVLKVYLKNSISGSADGSGIGIDTPSGVATSNIRVQPRAEGAPLLPRLATGVGCGPLAADAAASTVLSCPALRFVDAQGRNYTNTNWAWRVSDTQTSAVRTGYGRQFDAGRFVGVRRCR